MKLHKSLTADMLMAAVEGQIDGLGSPGYCVTCGTSREGVEPDAQRYLCEACGDEAGVYGAEHLLMMVWTRS